jgi:RimJ/RimL family protein N-acetyltransferase
MTMSNTIFTPQGEVTIRVASKADADLLFALRLEALTLHPESFAADYEKTCAEGAQAWVEIVSNYESNHSGLVVIACTSENLVGMLGITRGHWPKMAHTAILWGVYVQPDWRGHHIAEAMINCGIDWAKSNGVSVIYLGVNKTNTSAIQCYTRSGFYSYGTQPRVTYYNGIFSDQYLMAKLISS